MYQLIRDLSLVNRTPTSGRAIKYIVIHYTGNATDTAKANANYFRTVNRGASAHYFVDKTTVYQVVEDKDISWAVGRNYGSNNLFGVVTNGNSISIEMCSDGGKIADATFDNTVELTKSLMAKYGIPASNVYRHWDVCSKSCPGWVGWGASGRDGSIWNKFKDSLVAPVQPVVNPHNSDNYVVVGESNKMFAFETKTETIVRVAPNSLADVVTKLPIGSKQGITKITANGWGYIANGAGWIYLRDCKPLNAVSYQLNHAHCYVRAGKSNSQIVANLLKGSKQPICFISDDGRGYIANYAGWVRLKFFKKI